MLTGKNRSLTIPLSSTYLPDSQPEEILMKYRQTCPPNLFGINSRGVGIIFRFAGDRARRFGQNTNNLPVTRAGAIVLTNKDIATEQGYQRLIDPELSLIKLGAVQYPNPQVSLRVRCRSGSLPPETHP